MGWFPCVTGVALCGKDVAVNRYDRENRPFRGDDDMSFAPAKERRRLNSVGRQARRPLLRPTPACRIQQHRFAGAKRDIARKTCITEFFVSFPGDSSKPLWVLARNH